MSYCPNATTKRMKPIDPKRAVTKRMPVARTQTITKSVLALAAILR